ncbi:MAG: efflux RND transporter periplasmic adaptor subunit [Oligosphaeraceae bacterium]
MKQETWSALLAVALAALMTGCAEQRRAVGGKGDAVSVRVQVGELRTCHLRRQLLVQGTATPVDFAALSARVSGTLEKLAVDEGSRVRRGELLFGVDSVNLTNQVTLCEDVLRVRQSELEKARIALRTAEIARDLSRKEHDRAKSLFDRSVISASDYDAAKCDYDKAEQAVRSAATDIRNAEALLKQADSELRIARKNLADAECRSPFDGVVVGKYAEQNEFVSNGQQVVKVEDTSRLEVICHISAVHYEAVSVGKTAVEFLDNGRSLGFGTVTYRAPAISSESRTFKLKALVPEGVALTSGSLCEVAIILEERDAAAVPSDALLLRANDRHIVYVCGEGDVARSVEVKPGLTYEGMTEIVDPGELEGQRIIFFGQTFVNNGSKLQVMEGRQQAQ